MDALFLFATDYFVRACKWFEPRTRIQSVLFNDNNNWSFLQTKLVSFSQALRNGSSFFNSLSIAAPFVHAERFNESILLQSCETANRTYSDFGSNADNEVGSHSHSHHAMQTTIANTAIYLADKVLCVNAHTTFKCDYKFGFFFVETYAWKTLGFLLDSPQWWSVHDMFPTKSDEP